MNDPTYKVSKILMDLLNPLAKSGQSYVENAYDLKRFLDKLSIDNNDVQASFDVLVLYPSFLSLKHWIVFEGNYSMTQL